MKWLGLLTMTIALTACNYTEVKREIGYKGKARINPWLAAERFAARYEGEVRSLAAWTAPEFDDAVWFVPASILGNESFTRALESWVDEGGHLVVLVEHADSESSDWLRPAAENELAPALVGMLEEVGIALEVRVGTATVTAEKIDFEGKSYAVDAKSNARVVVDEGEPAVFASVESGDGRMTVLTDARLFRNRWIGDKDHAGLLDALIQATEYEGNIGFLRGYEHHLEALGDFQWRLDRAAALLVPLRGQIVERGQRMVTRAGRRDDDFFQFLAERAELPRERVFRALAETAPADSAILTRTAADLQRLLQVLH